MSGRTIRWQALLVAIPVALALSAAPWSQAAAELRIKNNHFGKICRVVAIVDSHKGLRKVYDGPMGRGQSRNFYSVGSVLCIQRSIVPERCNSGLTRPVCKVDRHSNRTVIWTIK